MRLRALNSPREGPASPAHPLVCRMSSELCLLADRSPESGGALEAAVGWWYWVGRGVGTALCFGQIHAHSAQHCWSLRGLEVDVASVTQHMWTSENRGSLPPTTLSMGG